MIKNKYKLTGLVADGLASNREDLIGILRDQGFCYFNQAPNGIEAFKLLKKRSPNLIIASMNMLELNGLSFLKLVAAEEHLYKIPFILITNSVNKELIVEAGKFGASAVLLEPVKAKLMTEKVAFLLNDTINKKNLEVETLFKRALQLFKKGSFTKALALYEEVLEINEDAEVYYNIGYIKAAQGKFDEALDAFRKAAMINNSHARAYKMMGVVYSKKGDIKKAQSFFEKAADIFLDRNMDEEAEKTLNESLKICPGTLNVYNTLGIICRKRKDYKSAINYYKKALRVSPDDEHILYNVGRAYIEIKQIGTAKKYLERALFIDSEFNEAKKMMDALEIAC